MVSPSPIASRPFHPLIQRRRHLVSVRMSSRGTVPRGLGEQPTSCSAMKWSVPHACTPIFMEKAILGVAY